MLAGVSSGIEPVFALSYKRKRKVSVDNPNKKFQDKQGDWWEEYEVRHPKLLVYLATGRAFIPEDSPYHKVTAHEIDPYTKLKLQSAVQPWIDHSISITYNLPSSVTEEDVSNLYFQAWKLGCKGLTVYRDSCREGILTTKEKFPQYDGFKRPKDVVCDAYNVKAKGQDWKVFIGIVDDLPYEVFAVNGTMEKVSINRGILRKIGSGRYDFLSPSGELVKENITANMTPDEEAFTRIISWALRHGS
jgi:ribonucleoside-diphosphate reductase alpha chain